MNCDDVTRLIAAGPDDTLDRLADDIIKHWTECAACRRTNAMVDEEFNRLDPASLPAGEGTGSHPSLEQLEEAAVVMGARLSHPERQLWQHIASCRQCSLEMATIRRELEAITPPGEAVAREGGRLLAQLWEQTRLVVLCVFASGALQLRVDSRNGRLAERHPARGLTDVPQEALLQFNGFDLVLRFQPEPKEHVFALTMELKPAPPPGSRVTLQLNGEPIGEQPLNNGVARFPGVGLGPHQLVFIAAEGHILATVEIPVQEAKEG